MMTIETDGKVETSTANPFDLLERLRVERESIRPDGMPPFFGGFAGYVSYDAVRYLEKLPEQAMDDLQTPDLSFYWYDEVAVFDEETKKLFIAVTRDTAEEATQILEEEVARWCVKTNRPQFTTTGSSGERERAFGQEAFMTAAHRFKS
jgi:para-aminobenzoate synthetase component 1